MRSDPSAPIPRLELERWALGRLDPESQVALETMGRADPQLQARMDRVRDELARASQDLPPLALPEEDEREAALPRWRSWRLPALGGLVLAATAALALVLIHPPEQQPDAWRGGEVMDIELVRVRAGQAQSQGALVSGRAGDRLQIVVSPPDAGWLQIYDLQDDGVVHSWLEPREVGAKQPLQRDVLLDDYPGTERIFVLYAAQPIPLDLVERSVQQAFDRPLVELDRLPLPGEVLQRSVLVVKDGPP
jgi:hypothetical protein